jgi:lysyl-tRNA synthetase class 2
MMELVERMFELAARTVNGSTKTTFRGKDYDLTAPFARVTYAELFERVAGFPLHPLDEAKLRAKALEKGVAVEAPAKNATPAALELKRWKLADNVLEACITDELEGPIFITDYPVAISPLAKRKPGSDWLTERFEVYVAGMELGNAFSELNDPAEQAARFEEQVASKDPEAPGEVDWDYVQALEYGMPPTGGLGIGIDRLVMVLTNQDSIRDVLLFPAMKPVANSERDGELAHVADNANSAAAPKQSNSSAAPKQ